MSVAARLEGLGLRSIQPNSGSSTGGFLLTKRDLTERHPSEFVTATEYHPSVLTDIVGVVAPVLQAYVEKVPGVSKTELALPSRTESGRSIVGSSLTEMTTLSRLTPPAMMSSISPKRPPSLER